MRQTIGILDDHGASEEPVRATLLEYRVWQTWSNEEWEAMDGPEREIELEIEDAALLLEGLAFTEAMSVDLPWFEMVQWTVDFMTQQLRPAWTEEEWTLLARG
ncbi:MAG: hypothetical protein R2710_05660 [Acidimicrobiales bacterium]